MLNNPREKKINLDQALQNFDAADKGNVPGFGAAQIDTFPQEDNVDATHPLNVDYFIPGNFQRLMGARLSFKLRAFRAYVNQVSSSSAAFVSTFVLLTTSAVQSIPTAQHSHTDPQGGSTGVGGNAFVPPATNVTVATGGVIPTTATAITSVGLSYGVFEGAVATGVTISIDGTDVTALLTPAGPYNADQLEIDLRPILTAARVSSGVWHTIQLTPSGLGRIHAFLRLTYFVDGQRP